jgi:HEAT repeat protein
MPRISYGDKVKQRTKNFVALILDYANDELLNEHVEYLRSYIQIRWQNEFRLVVRTTIRHLEALSNGDSLRCCKADHHSPSLTKTQIKEVLSRLEDSLHILEDNRPTRGGSQNWHFTLTFWHSRFDRAANLDRLEVEWQKLTLTHSNQSMVASTTLGHHWNRSDYWQQICANCLKRQKHDRLTSNSFTYSRELILDLEDAYIDLGIIDREGEGEKEEGISLTVQEFCNRLIGGERPQRVAIVGEPGTGKTTLLQKLALWLLEGDQALPIWISLADLQGKTLEKYLLEDWLKIALGVVRVPEDAVKEFLEVLYSSRVWLLLDAVDEMGIEPTVALSTIARQIEGWLDRVSIVITCRLNVWQSGKNPLYFFTTYRNQNLQRPQEAIAQWFQNSPLVGKKLQQQLALPRWKRYQDLFNNPLRLVLLCQIWSGERPSIPNTLSLLYQEFIEAIYNWKQDRFPTSLEERYRLNSVLGELALQGLSQSEPKFRFHRRLVLDLFETRECELFSLACQIGWLYPTDNNYYAFPHPTFQEYFAAQGISNWQDFLPKRIFQNQWREVILFWLGREEIANSEREAFLQALLDGDRDLISQDRACLLAVICTAEFPQFSRSEEAIFQAIRWRFGDYDPFARRWRYYPQPLVEAAKVALLQADRQKAISCLEKFIESTTNPIVKWQAAYSLGRSFEPKNPMAIAILTEFLQAGFPEAIEIRMAENLTKISGDPALAVDKLSNIIHTTQSLQNRRKAAYVLGKIVPNCELAVSILVELVTSFDSGLLHQQALANLAALAPHHLLASGLIKPKIQPRRTVRPSPRQPDLNKAIAALEYQLSIVTDEAKQQRLAAKLGASDFGNQKAIEVLMSLLRTSSQKSIRQQAAKNLPKIVPEAKLSELFNELNNSGNFNDQCYHFLWQIFIHVI